MKTRIDVSTTMQCPNCGEPMIVVGSAKGQHYICPDCKYELPYAIYMERGKAKAIFFRLLQQHLNTTDGTQ